MEILRALKRRNIDLKRVTMASAPEANCHGKLPEELPYELHPRVAEKDTPTIFITT
ncbi:hypothetical protein PSAC2689_220004 [Paraburkholderia sacchari]